MVSVYLDRFIICVLSGYYVVAPLEEPGIKKKLSSVPIGYQGAENVSASS